MAREWADRGLEAGIVRSGSGRPHVVVALPHIFRAYNTLQPLPGASYSVKHSPGFEL